MLSWLVRLSGALAMIFSLGVIANGFMEGDLFTIMIGMVMILYGSTILRHVERGGRPRRRTSTRAKKAVVERKDPTFD